MSTGVEEKSETQSKPPENQCGHGTPTDKRSFEKWLHAHGLSNRLSVRLAVAWPTSQEETEAEQAEKEQAEAIEVMARLTRILKEV